jgi:hypothetical protein
MKSVKSVCLYPKQSFGALKRKEGKGAPAAFKHLLISSPPPRFLFFDHKKSQLMKCHRERKNQLDLT